MVTQASIRKNNPDAFILFLPASPQRKTYGWVYAVAGLILFYHLFLGSAITHLSDDYWWLKAMLLSLPALLIITGLKLIVRPFISNKKEQKYFALERLPFNLLAVVLFSLFMCVLNGAWIILYWQYKSADPKIQSLLDGSSKSIFFIVFFTLFYYFFIRIIFPLWWVSLRELWATLKTLIFFPRYSIVLNPTIYQIGDRIRVRFPNFRGDSQRVFLNLVNAKRKPTRTYPRRTFYYSVFVDASEDQLRKGVELQLPTEIQGRTSLQSTDKQYWEILIESRNGFDWFRHGILVVE